MFAKPKLALSNEQLLKFVGQYRSHTSKALVDILLIIKILVSFRLTRINRLHLDFVILVALSKEYPLSLSTESHRCYHLRHRYH